MRLTLIMATVQQDPPPSLVPTVRHMGRWARRIAGDPSVPARVRTEASAWADECLRAREVHGASLPVDQEEST